MQKVGKIILNDIFYKGSDEYSDGDVENELIKIVMEEREFDSVIDQTDEFAIFYHLSKDRELITEVMDISPTDTVLEIGAGCGGITGALARKAKNVHCVELSKRRSLINAYKNQDCDNIQIFIGNYEDMLLTEKYDVVTLIGVLEYACYYIHSNRPYHDFLKDVRSKLNSEGRIYIAIENRLGAKYFSGCKEDHAGRAFEGIEGYPKFFKARTFSYYELIQLFEECGFKEYKFYYPYPDYKFPHKIFSDSFLPQKDEGFELASNYTSVRMQCFNETSFLKSLVMDKEFKLFSNSFLICLRK